MEKEISVVKRRNRGRETLNIEKIHEMVEYAVVYLPAGSVK